MKKFFEFFTKNAGLIGALYCIIPSLLLFAIATLATSLRDVYILRLALCCSVGAYIASRLNEAGLKAWQDKLRWTKGRTTVVDGVIIGSLVGLGVSLLPPLTTFIGAQSLPHAVLFIATVWLSGLLVGGVAGGLLAASGIKYMEPGDLESA